MGFLCCYTLGNEKAVEGIDVDAFECINVENLSTARINKAVLEFVPLFDCKSKDVAKIAARSLSFLNEPAKSDKQDDAGIIVAFDPEKWRLCYNASLYTLLDPCGTDGKILIMANKGARNVLAKAADKNTTFSVSGDNKPIVAKCRRASLLYNAVKGRLLYKELSKLEAPAEQAAPKKRAKPARS